MTLAELLLLIAGGAVMYLLLTPFRRSLERYLIRKFLTRHPNVLWRPTIDVTDFTSRESRRKEDRDDEHRT